MKPAEEKKMLSLVVKMFQFTPTVESYKLLLTVFLENDRMFVQSPLTLKIIAIFFFLCAAALQTHPAVFSTERSLWPDSSLPSVCDDRLISTRTITRPAAEPRASARNRSRNPNIVRMALTLSKDPAAGGAGEAGDCDRGTRKTLIASASGLNSQLTL